MIVAKDAAAKVVTTFPRRVREIEHVWIPMPDGVRLSARIWLPEDAEAHPVPAILEYIPYRKRDGTRAWDDPRHGYWAGHGYACIRLDIRGSGESEGIIADEYARIEQDDAVAAIAWIATQPWCTGAVGMTGISWGGFNALQVAARRPPALKAIITHCSTDDRYADDIHYMGGCVLGEAMFWGIAFFTVVARPADPLIVGECWRRDWLARLEATRPVAAQTWLAHQRRDAYWRHGSICEDYGAITAAVYAVGGWNDGYSNAVPRLLANLSGPRRGLVGPWGHKYPHDGLPGPAIGFLQEGLRWWDHWLKGRDTGIMAEPMYRVWQQDPVRPDSRMRHVPGRWVAEPGWPAANVAARRFVLGDGILADTPGPETRLTHRPVATIGAAGGSWCPYGLGGTSPDLPIDQAEDDGRSLTFDGPPVDHELAILGAPVVTLRLAVDRPSAFVAVRLNDVFPDGTVARITYGLLNLTHRNGHVDLVPMVPGREETVRVTLNDVAYALKPGHRLRVAVSTDYWPIVWPSPKPVTLTVVAGVSHLDLPLRTSAGLAPAPFPDPEMARPTAVTVIAPERSARTVERDLATGEQVIRLVEDGGTARLDPIGVEIDDRVLVEYRIREDDPLSARAIWTFRTGRRHPGWDWAVEARMEVWATATAFHVASDLAAFEDGRRLFSRSWNDTVARDHV